MLARIPPFMCTHTYFCEDYRELVNFSHAQWPPTAPMHVIPYQWIFTFDALVQMEAPNLEQKNIEQSHLQKGVRPSVAFEEIVCFVYIGG